MTDELPPTDHLRVSDAERHEVGLLLGRHFADGRLDEPELEDRLASAMAARTRGDLRQLLVDLPRLPAPLPAGRPPMRARRLAAVAAGLVALLVPASLLAHAGAEQMARFPFRHPPAIEIPGGPLGGRLPLRIGTVVPPGNLVVLSPASTAGP